MNNNYHKIKKSEFIKLNENDLMFITNPGRMGDEDGTTFIIKNNHEFTIYRIDGWMYKQDGEILDISLNDVSNQFPKWYETWKNNVENINQGKYKYLYMGFGNGLSVDNSIYNEFEPYLTELVEKYLENNDEKESLKYAAIYDLWEEAFRNMVNGKGYIIKNEV